LRARLSNGFALISALLGLEECPAEPSKDSQNGWHLKIALREEWALPNHMSSAAGLSRTAAPQKARPRPEQSSSGHLSAVAGSELETNRIRNLSALKTDPSQDANTIAAYPPSFIKGTFGSDVRGGVRIPSLIRIRRLAPNVN
jgi:hypothetical protein